jgi:hypothetical protein
MFRSGIRTLVVCLASFLIAHSAFQADASTNSPISFTSYYSLPSPGPVSVLDLDSNGRLDLFTAADPRFYSNNGTTFQLLLLFTNWSSYYDSPAEVADFDNDNDVDLLAISNPRTAPSTQKALRIFWNVASARTNSLLPFFQGLPNSTLPYVGSGDAAAADFDNDGDQDLFLTGNPAGLNNPPGNLISHLYANNGDGTFSLHSASFPGMEQSAVSWADYDSDGDFDLLLCGATNGASPGTSILYRNDHGVFVDSGLVLPPLRNASIAWGDYDKDADLDLFITGTTNRFGDSTVGLYRNDNGSLMRTPFALSNLPPGAKCAWADCDNDGDLDLILGASVFVNNGDSTFQRPVTLSSAAYARIHPADFNNDTKVDLLFHDFDGLGTVLRNSAATTNTPPSVPTNLVAVANGSSITFAWSPASDAEQTNGLSYNFRIGTAPGKSDVLSALANPTNGVRFVAQLGNTGLRTSWTIHNLGVGTYYWTVQAIDHSLGASRFAAEQSITISNAPPVAKTLVSRNVAANSAVAVGTIISGPEPVTWYWEYGTTNFSHTTAPQTGTPQGSQEVFALLRDLVPSTTYQYRLVATNSLGTSVSSTRFFITAPASALTEFPIPSPPLHFTPTCIPVDFDNDGDLDLLTCGVEPGKFVSDRSTTLYLNDSGVFTRSPLIIPTPILGSPTPVLTAATDFNNDSRVDLLYEASPTFVLLLSNADGTFREVQIPGSSFGAPLLPGDPDSDGDTDILAPRLDSSTVRFTPTLFYNDGLDLLRASVTPSLNGEFAALGDYDNDGDPDILLWGRANSALSAIVPPARILRNNGSATFTDAAANLPAAWSHAHWADYDNDGDLDVVIAGPATNMTPTATDTVRLFRNDSSAASTQFAEIQAGLTNGYVSAAQSVDFNADGLLDLLTTHFTGSRGYVRLHLNSGNIEFTEKDLGITNIFLRVSATTADLDGDTFPDLLLNVATNTGNFQLRLFHNNTTTPALRAPPVPTNLAAAVAPASAQLSWELPGNSNDSSGLTFNLRVGTTPGGSEIASPMSHRTTGFRRILASGNAGQGRTWTIRDLPPGTYYWSVQAINHANAASPFAPEATFAIPVSERPLRFVAAAIGPRRTHQLTVQGPVRARAELLTSPDLVTWTLSPTYIYLTENPAVITTGNFDTAFYRLRLQQNAEP